MHQLFAQNSWTLQQCMQYAVEHNHDIRQSEYELESHRAVKTGAITNFLPSIGASVGAQYNFGRAIDPETNTYTNVSTFYNGYQVYATLPVFDGFSRLYALRAAKASVLMGQSALRQQKDQTALAVMQAFTNVIYYQGTIEMAKEKVEETSLLLSQTKIMKEVGRKSDADVAQVESQYAEAEYNLILQKNLYESSMLELKKEMAYPLEDDLNVVAEEWSLYEQDNVGDDFLAANHSELEVSRLQMETARHQWRQAQSGLYPSISVSAGISTTYYKSLGTQVATSFADQLKNNRGEYVGVTLSIPLFSRFQTATSIRKAKNNYYIARETYEQKHLELEKLSREAWQDLQGYRMQITQATHKVDADSIAYHLTKRQFEEGLRTAIDLRSTSSQLLNSKATLLQCQLMTMVKYYLVRYYRGEQIWE